MLEEENKSVLLSGQPDDVTAQSDSTAEHPSDSSASEPESEHQSTTEPTAEENSEPEDKIAAIKSRLFQIAKEEEDESVSLRVAYQIRQVKQRKEHPEDFPEPEPQPPKAPKKKKRTMGQKFVGLFPQRGDSAGEVVRKSIFLLSAMVFLVCLVLILLYFVDILRTNRLYEDIGTSYHAALVETTTAVTEENTDETETTTEKVYTLLPGVEDLLAINDEINGWITIPDTKVDYPVLHHVDDEPGNEYYLYRNVQKEDSKPGSIFLDYRCSFDEVGEDGTLETPNSDNLIIYGHNMRDLSMFGTLKYYRTDEDYYEEHPIIELHSNYETYQYKIFAYFIADAEDTTDTRFEYWNAINFADETEFYDYVNEVKRRTLRITNVDVEYGDDLLTLSTCNSVFDTARLVIVARRVRDGEDPNERIVGSYANPNIKWPSVYYLWNNDTYDPDAPFAPYG
jgi:sortase B